MKKAFLCLIFALLGSVAAAAPVADLYQATVDVASHSVPDRQRAIKSALKAVLVKVSGNSAVATLPAIQYRIARSDKFVQRFSYLDNVELGNTQLSVLFEKKSVNQVLHDAGQGVWGADRPSLLAWIAVTDEQGRRLLNAEADPAIIEAINKAANARGIKIELPIMDLQDLSRVTINDVWYADMPALLNASDRYDSNAVIALQLVGAGSYWNGRWSVSLQGEQMSWTVRGDTMAQVIQTGMNDITDALAVRFATLNLQNTSSELVLTVDNVNTADAYTAVNEYLHGLDLVADVQVVSVDDARVIFQLKIQGSTQSLVQALTLKTILMPLDTVETLATPGLHYVFVL